MAMLSRALSALLLAVLAFSARAEVSEINVAQQYGVATPDGVTMLLMGKVDHAGAG